jgi:hypothetical protein
MTRNIIVDSREVEEVTAEEIERVAGGLTLQPVIAAARAMWSLLERAGTCNICIPEGEDIPD